MKNIILGIALTTIFFFSGCGEPQAKTTQYYNEHLDEAKAIVDECKNIQSPTMEQIKNCSNAKTSVWNNAGLKRIKGNEKSVKTWKE